MAGITRYVTWTGGPAGDYITDGSADQIEINAALAWANANPGNVIKMRGTGDVNAPHIYNITGQVNFGSSTVWCAEPGAKLFIPNGACGSSPSDCIFPDGKPVITQIPGTYPTDVEIYGFEIDGNCQNQSTKLGYVGGDLKSAGSGVERLIGIYGSSDSSYHITNINIHDMVFHDAFGEALLIRYGENIKFQYNSCSNHQHCGVFFKAVTGPGNEIHHNTIAGITSDCIRLDNCQNVNVYKNTLTAYGGSNNNGAALYGHNGIQIANASRYSTLTNNINVYDNTISGHNLCGIWINDALQKAGTASQNVHIHHNMFTDCGWASWAPWASGIGIRWGNGIVIEKNTINGSYCEGILVYAKITPSSTKVTVKNNNIINTFKNRAGSSGYPSVLGYGIANAVSAYITVDATGNWTTGNASGDYHKVIPSSKATDYIEDAIPDGGTGKDEDDPVEPGKPDGIYVPGTTSIIDDEYIGVKREAGDRSAYINHVPFRVVGFSGSGEKTIGESTSPSVAGSNLSDFNFTGSVVTFDCIAFDTDSLSKVLASFYQPGRSTIELGGVYDGYKITGVGAYHSTGWNFTKGDCPDRAHPYSLTFKCEKPYMEKIQKRARGRYIHNSTQFSSDDCYVGNRVKNPSFESWSANSSLDWDLQPAIAANSWENVKYSPELDIYCAIGSTGTNNRIMVSDGNAWRLPTDLTNATNCNNNWTAHVWCPDWLLWVALSSSGLSGYGCISSPDGDIWSQNPTPTSTDSNSWECATFIPAGLELYLTGAEGFVLTSSDDYIISASSGSELTQGRLIAFASSGTNRIMYSEDQCATWTLISFDAHNWVSAAYSPTYHRIVIVASDGAIAYSDDYADTWNIAIAPSQKWTSIIWAAPYEMFVVCSEDGDQQIMTSPTGLSNTWELQTTPYISSETKETGGTVVKTLSGSSPVGYNYTTKFLDYTLVYTYTLPALQNGHIYRIDNIRCRLRTLNSAYKAYLKVTVSSTSLGTDVLLKEWTEKSTTYTSKSLNLALESATNETVTIKFWIKSLNTSIKTGADLMGYTASEMTAAGSTIIYTRSKLSGLTCSNAWGLIIAISRDLVNNKIMYSTGVTNWNLGDSASNDPWSAVCASDSQEKVMAVSTSGKSMMLDGYGSMENVAPSSWTLVNKGQARSSEYVIDGLYSLCIAGDGVTAEPGLITQIVALDSKYDSGETFVLSGRCTVTGLTSGSFRGDIYAGGTVIKELIWDANAELAQKQIKFKFDVVPSTLYIRVHGSGTPNAGSYCYFDDMIIEKESEFEIAETGTDIITNGYCDVIPDVTVRGVSTSSASPSSSKTVSEVTSTNEVFESLSTSYGVAVHEVVLPALTGGSRYKIDELSCKIKSSNALAYTYMKITVQAASLFGGKETDISMWTTNKTSFYQRTYILPYTLESATNEKVIIRYYLRISKKPYRAFATLLGYKYTEVTDTNEVGAEEIYLYNTSDPRMILKCCNALPQGYMIQIKSNYTGSYRYIEPFEDDAYVSNAYSSTGTVARNEANNSLVMSAGSSIVFPFSTLYPVTGIPFIKMFVLSGIPQISIAADTGANGAPGTFYPVDSNTPASVTNAEIERELDNKLSLSLRGLIKYYVKIEPYAGQSCEFCQMLEYASLDTMDALRPFIYQGVGANMFAVVVGDGTGKCSAVLSLGYHDADILP